MSSFSVKDCILHHQLFPPVPTVCHLFPDLDRETPLQDKNECELNFFKKRMRGRRGRRRKRIAVASVVINVCEQVNVDSKESGC